MHTNLSAFLRKVFLGFIAVGVILSLCSIGIGLPTARAQNGGYSQPTEQPAARILPLSDEHLIEEHIINGPPAPPPGFEAERQAVEAFASSAVIIDGVPAYTWTLGCSASGGGMTAAYNDKLHPNLFPGEMPLDDIAMPIYTDVHGDKYKLNLAVVSEDTFKDYWVCRGSSSPDPFTGFGTGCAVPAPRPNGNDVSTQSAGWPQHAWGDVLGDFMYTSQSEFDDQVGLNKGNKDGDTKFYTYQNSASPFTCDEMSSNSLPDGTLGTKLFYETRGYAVGECYNQPTDNVIAGGFSFAQFKAEIDAGRPVMIGLENHTVVGIGYDPLSNTVYLHDGWDNATHTMTWGGSYTGMALQMVSIVNIAPGIPNTYTISGNTGVPNATITYTSGYTTADANGDYSFTVVSGWFGTVTPSKPGYTFAPAKRSYANVVANRTAQNYLDAASGPVNLLPDPSFEEGSPNPSWKEASTNFGTPLCNASCGGGARTGSVWGWFGGTNANETASLSQKLMIPNGSAALEFYFWIGYAGAGSDSADVFTASIDGTPVFSANATQIGSYPAYKLVSVNVSAYANGASHTLAFSSVTTGQQVDFHLDDVALISTISSTHTVTPTLTQTLTITPTITRTVTSTVTQTPTITRTPTKTLTPTLTGSVTFTPTGTSTITKTPTSTITRTSTITLTPTVIPTKTTTSTVTATRTPVTRTFISVAAQDGWILESTETSNVGGTLDATAATFRLGDDNLKKQYLGILSFSTKSLPDDAVITKVTLKIKKQGITGGGNPVTTFQGFMVDIKKGTFGAAALQIGDFQAPLGVTGKTYGPFKPALVGGWYSLNLTSGSAYINKAATASGLTQIRLRFKLDDNNNAIANYLSLYSGNAPASQPQLIIEYYVP